MKVPNVLATQNSLKSNHIKSNQVFEIFDLIYNPDYDMSSSYDVIVIIGANYRVFYSLLLT